MCVGISSYAVRLQFTDFIIRMSTIQFCVVYPKLSPAHYKSVQDETTTLWTKYKINTELESADELTHEPYIFLFIYLQLLLIPGTIYYIQHTHTQTEHTNKILLK